ncbi:hypothetical protein Hanom_Chr09g00855111 [Helianthus anomalus]
MHGWVNLTPPKTVGRQVEVVKMDTQPKGAKSKNVKMMLIPPITDLGKFWTQMVKKRGYRDSGC